MDDGASPRVVLIAGGSACGQAAQSSALEVPATADVRLLGGALRGGLGPDTVEVVHTPRPAQLRQSLLAGDNSRGLVVFYSGHGRVAKTNESLLCLGGAETDVSVETLLASFLNDAAKQGKTPPWIFVVLNACESAYVDVSRLSVPTAVLSASRYDVGVHQPLTSDCAAASLPTSVEGGQPSGAASTLAVLLTSVLQDPEDRDCDGVLSDQELFESLRAKVAHCIPRIAEDPPLPTLRRQAASPLPLFAVTKTEPCRAKQQARQRLATLAAADDPELAAALNPDPGAVRRPKALSRDYFVIGSLAEHAACWRMFKGTTTPSETTASAVTTSLCEPDAALPLRPLPPRVAAEARNLARMLSNADVYEVREDGAWADVIDLGRRRLVSTVTSDHLPNAFPKRSRIVSRWSQRDQLLAYFSRGVPQPCVADDVHVSDGLCDRICTRRFVPCPGGEGQCFLLDPTLQDVCKGRP